MCRDRAAWARFSRGLSQTVKTKSIECLNCGPPWGTGEYLRRRSRRVSDVVAKKLAAEINHQAAGNHENASSEHWECRARMEKYIICGLERDDESRQVESSAAKFAGDVTFPTEELQTARVGGPEFNWRRLRRQFPPKEKWSGDEDRIVSA